MQTSVTFDSNVWESIVDEMKRVNDVVYEELYQAIAAGKILPFFFEGIVTMENITKKDRKDFIGGYKATISVQVADEAPKVTQGSPAPELTDYLKSNIPKALQFGFRFIKFPRIGAVGLDNAEKYFAKDEKFPLAERLDRSFKCAKFIESLGSGKSRLHGELEGSNDKGIVNQTANDQVMTDKKYAKHFGEWVDGDALAAHYGYGIDYFCTNDRASGAGTGSIFSQNNLSQLKIDFGVQVVTPDELLRVVGVRV